MSGCTGTLPVVTSWAGAIDPPDLEEYNHIVFVAATNNVEEDGSLQFPFSTVAEGLAEAIARSPSALNKICVYVYSGIYIESGLTPPEHVHLQGVNPETTILRNENNILNVTTDNTSVSNLTFQATSTNSLITIDGTSITDYVAIRRCHFLGNGSDNNVVDVKDDALCRFYSCIFQADNVGDTILQTDSDTGNDCKIYKSNVVGDITHAGGDLEFTDCTLDSGITCTNASDLSVTDTFWRNSIEHCVNLQTTGNIFFYQSTFISPGDNGIESLRCINVTAVPATAEWIGNSFRHTGDAPDYTLSSSVSLSFVGDRNNFEEGYNSLCTDIGLATKATPVVGDILVIEDSEDRYKRKRVEIDDLPVGATNHSDLGGIGPDDHHAHANKTELDLISDGDHDIRTDNPHVVTKTQVGLSNVTNDEQLKRAGNDWTGLTFNPSPWENDLVLLEQGTDGSKRTTTVGGLISTGLEEHEASSNGLSTTTSTSDIDKVTLTSTLEGGDYLVQYSAEASANIVNRGCLVKAFVDTTELERKYVHRDSFYQPGAFSGFSVNTLAGGTYTFKITFARVQPGSTARIRRAKITVRRLRS